MFKRHHLKQNYSDTMQPIDSVQCERRSTHKPSTPLFEASLKMCVHSNGVEPTLWASQLECWWIPESKCVSKCDSECSNSSRTSAWYITRCRRWASVFCFPFFLSSKNSQTSQTVQFWPSVLQVLQVHSFFSNKTFSSSSALRACARRSPFSMIPAVSLVSFGILTFRVCDFCTAMLHPDWNPLMDACIIWYRSLDFRWKISSFSLSRVCVFWFSCVCMCNTHRPLCIPVADSLPRCPSTNKLATFGQIETHRLALWNWSKIFSFKMFSMFLNVLLGSCLF